jgi:hypothetical protein
VRSGIIESSIKERVNLEWTGAILTKDSDSHNPRHWPID